MSEYFADKHLLNFNHEELETIDPLYEDKIETYHNKLESLLQDARDESIKLEDDVEHLIEEDYTLEEILKFIQEDAEWAATQKYKRPIAKAMSLHRKIEKLEHEDARTGIYNQEGYEKEVLSQSEDREQLVMFMDLNWFKQINDVFGHEVGDRALELFVAATKNIAYRHFTHVNGSEFDDEFGLNDRWDGQLPNVEQALQDQVNRNTDIGNELTGGQEDNAPLKSERANRNIIFSRSARAGDEFHLTVKAARQRDYVRDSVREAFYNVEEQIKKLHLCLCDVQKSDDYIDDMRKYGESENEAMLRKFDEIKDELVNSEKAKEEMDEYKKQLEERFEHVSSKRGEADWTGITTASVGSASTAASAYQRTNDECPYDQHLLDVRQNAYEEAVSVHNKQDNVKFIPLQTAHKIAETVATKGYEYRHKVRLNEAVNNLDRTLAPVIQEDRWPFSYPQKEANPMVAESNAKSDEEYELGS